MVLSNPRKSMQQQYRCHQAAQVSYIPPPLPVLHFGAHLLHTLYYPSGPGCLVWPIDAVVAARFSTRMHTSGRWSVWSIWSIPSRGHDLDLRGRADKIPDLYGYDPFRGEHGISGPAMDTTKRNFPQVYHSILSWLRCSPLNTGRVFAMYQILLGWKTCKCYYETDELPNPRPTQPKKK